MGTRSPGPQKDIAGAVSWVLRAASFGAAAAVACTASAQPVEATTLAADIPAQPLSLALATFAQHSGLELVYVSSIVQRRRSHRVSAGLDVDRALSRLLQGSGLQFEHLTPHSVRIFVPATTPRSGPDGPPTSDVEEVIVTASRREENMQDVPITMSVLTNARIAQLNVATFDDLLEHLPGITAHGVGPGQSSIFVRGLGMGELGIQGSGVNASFPNVAVYLDEQSTQIPHRNLDVYAVDLDRIELLEGPQGTLFGAGAEAGVIRYITNKPKLDRTEAIAHAGYAMTTHGAPSSQSDVTVNLPVVANHMAVRAVIYDERRGGYIDNTPATFRRAATDYSIGYAFTPNAEVPANSVVINNFGPAAKDFNPVTYRGVRVAAEYDFDEQWKILLAEAYQRIEADGVFTAMAADALGVAQPDLTVQLFNSSYDKDWFENTALTVEGRIGALKLVYAGAYLLRRVDQVQDYTNYARGFFIDYYQCVNPQYQTLNAATAQCFSPSSTWRDQERNTHQSHELRLSTPDDWRMRGVGGLFYENYNIQELVDWYYLTAVPYFNPLGPPTGYYTVNGSVLQSDLLPVAWNTTGAVFVPHPVTSINPSTRPPNDGFFNDITRGYRQAAAYASVDFDLVPHALTLTAGTRYYRINVSEVGSTVGGFGCQLISNPSAPNPCINHSNFINLDAEGLNRTWSGFKSRANVSWRPADDALLYYTWSQGFRAGGFNRGPPTCTCSPLTPAGQSFQAVAGQHGGWSAPLAFAPDTLTNNELGWKTRWLDGRLQWNGAVYQEDWDHVQTGAFSWQLIGEITTALNGGNYRVRGLETSVTGRIVTGLTMEFDADWHHSALIKEASFRWADGTPIDFSTIRLYDKSPVANPLGTLGSPLAGSPPFHGTLLVRYEWSMGGIGAFVQAGLTRQAHSYSSTDSLSTDPQGNSVDYELPPFTIYDAATGFGTETWSLDVYGENLTDTRARLYANFRQYYQGVTVGRPRTVGLRLGFRFGRAS